MHTKSVALLAGLVTLGAAAATAWAQSAPTCSFDPGTATVTVTVDRLPAEVSTGSTGKIRLNGELCGAATVTTTDAIQMNGSPGGDLVTVSGTFAPGLTAEADGTSEIEISFTPGNGIDYLTMNFGDGADRIEFTAGGVDVGDDGDQDISFAGVERLALDGGAGNDIIDARAYAGGGFPYLHGGAGNDRLHGSPANDQLYGEAGDDFLYGMGGNDGITGGLGDDSMFGGAGADNFYGEAVVDGTDYVSGGAGGDRISYRGRTIGVNVTLDGAADDGEPGENDLVEVNVEKVVGGNGDDVLVGSSRDNIIQGDGGNDEIHGGAGDDELDGGGGDDSIFGDEGNDRLDGSGGQDILTGGPGLDLLIGDLGNDIIFNADGEADTVECGDGTDDAEPDPLDTLTDCEL